MDGQDTWGMDAAVIVIWTICAMFTLWLTRRANARRADMREADGGKRRKLGELAAAASPALCLGLSPDPLNSVPPPPPLTWVDHRHLPAKAACTAFCPSTLQYTRSVEVVGIDGPDHIRGVDVLDVRITLSGSSGDRWR